MSKELKALLESELLNDETKQALQEAVEAIRTEARKELEVEFAKRFADQKDEMETALYEAISEIVSTELAELKEDVAKYRTLEVDYATKLEEFKTEYAKALEESVSKALEEQVKAEFTEVREDLIEAKKLNFGKKLFEAFAAEFEEFGVGEDVKDLRKSIRKLRGELSEANNRVVMMQREQKIGELLENLKGKSRDVMRTLLENVETAKLEERYNEVIGSVLDEGVKPEAKKEVVNESVEVKEPSNEDLEHLRGLINYGRK